MYTGATVVRPNMETSSRRKVKLLKFRSDYPQSLTMYRRVSNRFWQDIKGSTDNTSLGDTCCAKKIKCDLGKPVCSNCQLYNVNCTTTTVGRRAGLSKTKSTRSIGHQDR